jgi:hypothetical protein
MNRIAEVFERRIDRTIEEVIKVDQANETTVQNEIEEYIATDSIKDQFAEVYREIAAGPSTPREGVGVWVSGFFGSGKSSFAKILGYTVAKLKVGDTTATELFKKTLQDARIIDLLDLVTKRIPFHAVIFDVSMDRGVRAANDRLTEIMYRALLRELGYAEDIDLAELEITLEGDDRLQAFERKFFELHGKKWEKRRQLGLAINEASAALHDLDPKTYPTADSYAQGIGTGRADVDPNKLARRAFELCGRRHPGKALIFIIDEVGQYVSRSVDKMLDLQAIIQAFGVEGKNRTERRETVSPFWIVVTSQEKLNEIVTALDNKKIELARLQDRFRITVDLKQSDITEVTSERVLKKNAEASDVISKLFDADEPRIKQCCTLERTHRNLEINRPSFVRLYPYLPYQIDLCIDIVAGLRLKRGAHRHVGGSNRTIIKQAQQMMINDRTRLGDQPIGTLVTLDKVYELLEVGNLLPTEVSREVANVSQRLPSNKLAHQVVKAIALLESVKDLPRTPHNIAVVLHPSVGAQPLAKEVVAALKELEEAQFIRQSEEGYKLLTVQEKNWDTQRNGRDPREADRNKIHRELIKEIFSEPKLRSYRYKDLRGFRTSLIVNGEWVESDGEIPLNILLASRDEHQDSINEARESSVSKTTELFWVATLTDEIHALVTELFRSREMAADYDRLAAQQRLTIEETGCLSDEKSRRDRIQRNLRAKLLACMEGGNAFFGGVNHDAAVLGSTLSEALGALLERVVPVLYPKLEIGVLRLNGDEPDKFLTSANLNGLPQIFYHDRPERSLVVKQSDRFVPNLGCELCRELFDYLKREHSYGNRITGKMLESQFSGLSYAWERESIRLGLAILFRGGAIEVTHQGRKYRNYTEPTSRVPFVNNPAFRSASFSPRESLDLKVLANAARMYEEITGRDVDIEEGAIAQAFKQVAAADRERLLPLAARLSALRLPGAEIVQEQLHWVDGILEMPADDCVKTLAGDGKAYLEGRRQSLALEKAATEENIQTIARARRVLTEQWPILTLKNDDPDLKEAAAKLEELLQSETALSQIDKLRFYSETLSSTYRTLYENHFEKRKTAFTVALDQIKGRPEWLAIAEDPDISPDQRELILQPLSQRAEAVLDLPVGATVCQRTGATLAQMESDLAAVESISRDVLRRIQELAAPEEKIERVSIARLFPSRISNETELDVFLTELKARLTKVLAQGGTIILE